MTTLIETGDLVCGYDRLPIVRNLNINVQSGEIVCLLGANGAGKSTTLLTIAGVLPKLAGSLGVLGEPVTSARPDVIARRGLSIVPEGRGLFYKRTVAENLRLRKHKHSSVSIEDVLKYLPPLAGIMGRKAGLLSGGEQQMLALAGALVADPTLMMLDEMSLGLAPIIVERLLTIVRQIADERGMAVLLVEQHIQSALRVADRGYVLAHGRIVAEGSASELRRDAEVLEASYLGDAKAIREAEKLGLQ